MNWRPLSSKELQAAEHYVRLAMAQAELLRKPAMPPSERSSSMPWVRLLPPSTTVSGRRWTPPRMPRSTRSGLPAVGCGCILWKATALCQQGTVSNVPRVCDRSQAVCGVLWRPR